jgi:lipopolysaccharide export system protein LptA
MVSMRDMTGRPLRRGALATLLVAALLVPATGHAQGQRPSGDSQPNALQGFAANRNVPVQIEADQLELRDKDKTATFTGNVQVVQGDTQMRARQLVVHYEEQQGNAGAAQQASVVPGGQGQIRRLEARGDVAVRQKDQVATGDAATFDMHTNTVVLTGNVTLAQGRNVLKGERVVVDLKSGVSRVEAGNRGSGRVQGLFTPSEAPRPPAPRP